MKQNKLLFCALLLSSISISAAFASEDSLITPSTNGVFRESIVLEKVEDDNSSVNFVTPTTQETEEQGAQASAYADETERSGYLAALEGDSNIKPVYDLKGGVEKAPEAAPEAAVQEEPQTTKESFLGNWWGGDYATGNWFGFRQKMMDHGITIDSNYMQSSFGKGHGGMNDARAVRGYSLYNLSATFDTEKMGLWKGGTGFLLYQLKKGMGLSTEYMGDYQVIDGWDFREMNQLSEAWYQQKLFKDRVRLKFGKLDANTDFCALATGFDFINTSFSIMPTAPLPCYPDQKFGLMVEVAPKPWFLLRNGIYHKEDGAFNVTEAEVKTNIKGLAGRAFVGYWAQSREITTTTGLDMYGEPITRTDFKNYGAYAAFEQMIYKEDKKDETNQQGLTLIGQVGFTPTTKNDVNRYFGAALHYRGIIPKRDNDIMGVGVASANFSTRLADIDSRTGQENAFECFYRIQVNPWLYFQPDVQFIMNPGGSYQNSVALGFRSVIKF